MKVSQILISCSVLSLALFNSIIAFGQSEPTQTQTSIDSFGNPFISFKVFDNHTWTVGNDGGHFHINKGASIDGSYLLRMTADENVGIGTSPVTKFHVNGTGSKVLIGDSGGVLSKLTVNAEAGTEIARFNSDGTTHMIVDEDGKVGIGKATFDPSTKFAVEGNSVFSGSNVRVNLDASTGTTPTLNFLQNGDFKSRIFYNTAADALHLSAKGTGLFLPNQLILKSDSERIGMGTLTPATKLDVQGRSTSNEHLINAEVNYSGSTDVRAITGRSVTADGYGEGGHFTGGFRGVYGNALGGSYTGIVYGIYGSASSSAGTAYSVYAAGDMKCTSQLFVGTSTIQEDAGSNFEVLVDGEGLFEEVKIKNSLNWPDYVFDESYQLLPIDAMRIFIRTNGHLPGIPSADAIAADGGYFIGDLQKKQLEKIEELSLYIIQLHQENQALRREKDAIRNEVNEVKSQLQKLTELVQQLSQE